MIKKRPRHYHPEGVYTLRTRRAFNLFLGSMLYFYDAESKHHLLRIASLIENSLKLGNLSLGIGTVGMFRQHKVSLGLDGDLKRITYEKS